MFPQSARLTFARLITSLFSCIGHSMYPYLDTTYPPIIGNLSMVLQKTTPSLEQVLKMMLQNLRKWIGHMKVANGCIKSQVQK